MPNNYLSVLYKHIIQVEIKNVAPPLSPLPTPVQYLKGKDLRQVRQVDRNKQG